MARQPGSTSGITAFITATWSLLMMAVLIAGHLGMILVAYTLFKDGTDLTVMFTDMMGLPIWTLWLSIAGALSMDAWIYFHIFNDRKEALRR